MLVLSIGCHTEMCVRCWIIKMRHSPNASPTLFSALSVVPGRYTRQVHAPRLRSDRASTTMPHWLLVRLAGALRPSCRPACTSCTCKGQQRGTQHAPQEDRKGAQLSSSQVPPACGGRSSSSDVSPLTDWQNFVKSGKIILPVHRDQCNHDGA